MPSFPYTFDYSTGREFYGPSLSDPKRQPDIWSTRPPSGFYEERYPVSGQVATAAGLSALFASGFISYKGGNLWDKYVGAMRMVEEYSPGGIFRTFQASTFFSQFTSQARAGFHVAGEYLRDTKEAGGYADYLARLVGESADRNIHSQILQQGVTLKRGSLYLGKDTSRTPLLKYAGAFISPVSTKIDASQWVGGELGKVAGKHYGSAYSRSIGAKMVTDAMYHGDVAEELGDLFHRQIQGGQTRLQNWGRQLGGWGTEWVSRFNRLLEAPFEMQPFSTVFGKVQSVLEKTTGRKIQLAVQYGSGMEMMGRLASKYGPIAGALTLAYGTADHLLKSSELLEGTTLGTGITGTLATGYIKGSLAASKAADLFGLHSYREAQEELAPGSTSLSRLLAFPIMGMLGAAGIGYAAQVSKMASMQYQDKIGAAAARRIVSEELGEWGGEGLFKKMGTALADRRGLYARKDWIGKVIKYLAQPVSRESDELTYKFLGKMTPTKFGAVLGGAAGLAMIAPFLPGALIPGERPEELEAIYSGEQEVAIRKGRWWEFGRSPWEGKRIKYFRPHWYPRMMSEYKDKAIWGDDAGMSPIDKWYTREFTYDLEKRDYYDRPYPVTSLPFEDVPLIGPLLANTIGRLIKPPVLMHTEEWLGQGGEVKAMAPGFGERRATEIGEEAPGMPISPHTFEGAVGEQAYRMTEMIGLPGFTMVSLKEALTGTPDLYDQIAQLESARRAYGFERDYWDLEIGGGIGTTEFFRRLYPHRRRQIPLYNPIRNTMPEWLPGPGEKSPDFLHGDPYTKVEEGELRLPGRGYEARFPELEGFSPDEYPLIHRYKILADVAPYSDKYKLALKQIRAQRKLSDWTEYEEQIFQTTQEQVQQRKIKKEFDEYEYLTPMGEIFGDRRTYADESSDLLSTLNEMKASNQDEPGIFTKLFGGYWEMLSHNAETALDTMTPVSPGAKLVHQRTAIEDYHRTMAYGTENAFWSHPFRDFIRPTLTAGAAGIGFTSIPDHVQDRRGLTEYFDILEYVKYSRLSNIARMSNDFTAAKEFENKKNETLFGLNPFTYNYSHIFRALPRNERDYFNAFSAADTMEERAKILEMVPDNEKGLYVARWKLQFKEDVEKARKAGLLTEEQESEAEVIMQQIDSEAKSEGMPTSKELFAEYLATKMPGENYGDWYRRTKLLPDVPLPGPDWVGWHPSVDLEDVKLKLVQSMGEDMHEYDLWPSRAQALMNKPYINQSAIAPFFQDEGLDETEMRARVDDLMMTTGGRAQSFFRYSNGISPRTVVDIEQDVNIEATLEKML